MSGSTMFDWYLDYEALRPSIKELLPNLVSNVEMLLVGCGNSPLGEKFYDDGFRNITLVDFAEAAIAFMKTRSANKRPELKYYAMDVCRLPFVDNTFKVVIDKGTVDCVLCDIDPKVKMDQLLSHISRVLTEQGVFLVVSFGGPDDRLSFFDMPKYSWSIHCYVVKKPSIRDMREGKATDYTPLEYDRELHFDSDAMHYLYVMKKTGPTQEQDHDLARVDR